MGYKHQSLKKNGIWLQTS